MILTKSAIKQALTNKDIVIEPLNECMLNPNSVDVTLNKKLVVYVNPILNSKAINEFKEIEIPKEGFTLYPGELYLGMTNEYTETNNLVPILEGKSSLARLGLSIHSTAGYGDVGFCGNWTLEISCIKPIKIYADMRIGQLYYQEIIGDTDALYTGKYQNSRDVGVSKSYKDFT